MTEDQQTERGSAHAPRERTWPDYVIVFIGSIAGTFLLGVLFASLLVRWVYELRPGSFGLVVYGQFLIAPLGSAVGAALALRLFRRRSPWLTGLLVLPVAVVVGIGVYVLAWFIDTMGYGWLIIVPPVIAPLGARFIALGRKSSPPPPRQPRAPREKKALRDWPIGRIVRYGVPSLLLVSIAALVIFWPDAGTDVEEQESPGPRVCECASLTESLVGLAITEGNPLREFSLRTTELSEGFVVVASQFVGDDSDGDYFWTGFDEVGATGAQLIDEPDQWSATFFEGDARGESPWVVDVTLLDSHVEMTIRARFDGSEWGIATTDDLWEIYTADQESADEVHRQRQARAIEVLEPVRLALGVVEN